MSDERVVGAHDGITVTTPAVATNLVNWRRLILIELLDIKNALISQ